MEDQVGLRPVEPGLERRRRRVPRKRTMAQRIEKWLEMPHVSRSRRNQRVAIVAMIVLLVVYLAVAPAVSDMFGKSPATTSTAPPPKAGLKK